MKLKLLGFALSALALMAIGAGTASATTLEVGGATKNESIEIQASLEIGESLKWTNTAGTVLTNTCTSSQLIGGTVSPFTGAIVSGPFGVMSFTNCVRTVTVHKAGSFTIEHIAGTTNGTVRSVGAEITVGSPNGTMNCKTGEGTHIGTLTGVGAGAATLHINAVLNCGFLDPSTLWRGSYWITSPAGLGVSA